MAFSREKDRAIALRKRGKSIGEIVSLLGMKKSTVGAWCRDIRLSERHHSRILRRQRARGSIGLMKSAELKRAKRIADIKREAARGSADIGPLTDRDILILGIGLYWGEGYKNANGEFGFTNSSAGLIRAFLTWVQRCYGIRTRDLVLRVSINESYREHARQAVRFWSSVTKVPAAQFTKTSIIYTKLKKIYASGAPYHGTLRIKVRRGVSLQRRVLGSIAHISTAVGGSTRRVIR